MKLIDEKISKFQRISLYKHKLLGKILVLDKEVQHVEKWAPFYHEMLVHQATAYLQDLKDVLILGGGSLFAAYEVLKYHSVKNLSLIDHDRSVIDITSANYKHAKKVIKDRRFNLQINDAFDYLEKDKNKYDLIINDSIDLLNNKRRRLDLLNLLSSKLKRYGICSDVVYRHIFERKTTLKTIFKLNKNYESSFSLITVPEYPGIFHVLCLWSKSNKFIKNDVIINPKQKQYVNQKNSIYLSCQFYHPRFLYFFKYLPPYLKNTLRTENL